MNVNSRPTLQDFGERRLVDEILPKFLSGIDDDCALVELKEIPKIVITTDPVPEPAAKLLGNDSDFYWMGWLLVTINASDLAAAGAAPLAFVASIEAPSDMKLADFERFLAGISESSSTQGLRYVGGNLREGTRLSAVGTALGGCVDGRFLRRSGAREGDLVLSIGAMGIFWRDVLILQDGGEVSKDHSPLFRPMSQISVMNALVANDLIIAAIDNSDGLIPSLSQFAKANRLSIQCELDRFPRFEEEKALGIDSVRLALGWGDWNVIVAAKPESLHKISMIARERGSDAAVIGHFTTESEPVVLCRGGVRRVAPRLESERFSSDSWFSTGVQGYCDLLRNVELP